MKPLLAHNFEPSRWDPTIPTYVQPKLNGVRALFQAVEGVGYFQTRDEMPWAQHKLAHLANPLAEMFPVDVILDGELYVHGWPLQRIVGATAVNSPEVTEDTFAIEYHVFDVVNWRLPFVQRIDSVWRELWVTERDHKIRAVKTVRLRKGLVEAEDLYASFVGQGYEGMMYRLGDCPYTIPKQRHCNGMENLPLIRSPFLSDKNNRCWHLLKRKDWRDGNFLCVGVEEGKGKRRGMVGAFICKLEGGKTFRVGSGVTDAEAIHYLQNPPINREIRVKFLTYTSDGKPFKPTIEAIMP